MSNDNGPQLYMAGIVTVVAAVVGAVAVPFMQPDSFVEGALTVGAGVAGATLTSLGTNALWGAAFNGKGPEAGFTGIALTFLSHVIAVPAAGALAIGVTLNALNAG
jgi:hypothetical protein